MIQRPIFRPRSVARPQYRSRLSVVSRSCRFTSPLSHRDARAFLVTVKTQVRTATTMESRAVDVPARNIDRECILFLQCTFERCDKTARRSSGRLQSFLPDTKSDYQYISNLLFINKFTQATHRTQDSAQCPAIRSLTSMPSWRCV